MTLMESAHVTHWMIKTLNNTKLDFPWTVFSIPLCLETCETQGLVYRSAQQHQQICSLCCSPWQEQLQCAGGGAGQTHTWHAPILENSWKRGKRNMMTLYLQTEETKLSLILIRTVKFNQLQNTACFKYNQMYSINYILLWNTSKSMWFWLIFVKCYVFRCCNLKNLLVNKQIQVFQLFIWTWLSWSIDQQLATII